MSIKNILILGDSTSMSIGYMNNTFPFYLSQKKIWSINSKIFNSSLHGFGSADAVKFIKKNIFEDIDCVILNLGICDSIATENPKKKYRYLNKFFKKNKNINNINYHNLNYEFDNNRHSPEKSSDFIDNIHYIVNYFVNKKIKVIVLIPDSNFYFQPGLAKGNFNYYYFYNLIDNSSDLLNFDNTKFKLAYKLTENKNFLESNKLYLQILNDLQDNENNNELKYIISNNYAINDAYLGKIKYSIDTLKILLDESSIRKEIIHYNLSKIYQEIGDLKNYEYHTSQSYEKDINNYRISDVIRKKLNLIQADNNYIFKFDIRSLNNINYFDHCHLDHKGHEEMANKLSFIMTSEYDKFNCYSNAKIVNILYNPQYSLGIDKSFIDYFQVNTSPTTNITDQLNNISLIIDDNNIQKIEIHNEIDDNLFNAIKYFIKHPFFVDIELLKKMNCLHNYYFGKFPELYLITLVQQVYNYLNGYDFLKNIDIDSNLFINLDERSLIFNNLNLKHSLEDVFEIEKLNIESFLDKMIQNIKNCLNIFNLTNNINQRRKYTMYWFLRESIKFGTQSRKTMLYDFNKLQFLYEASILGIGLSRIIDFKNIVFFKNLKQLVEKFRNENEIFIDQNFDNLFNSKDLNYKNYNNEIKLIN